MRIPSRASPFLDKPLRANVLISNVQHEHMTRRVSADDLGQLRVHDAQLGSDAAAVRVKVSSELDALPVNPNTHPQ